MEKAVNPPDTLEQKVPSAKQTYQTKGDLYFCGKAIAVKLTDAKLDHDEGVKPHMTVVFSNDGYKDEDILELQNLIKVYKESTGLAQNHLFTFTLDRWGASSDKILGELQDLCEFLRNNYTGKQDAPRIPHVALRKGAGRRR